LSAPTRAVVPSADSALEPPFSPNPISESLLSGVSAACWRQPPSVRSITYAGPGCNPSASSWWSAVTRAVPPSPARATEWPNWLTLSSFGVSLVC
jgi:hypothetical protein